MRLRSAIPMMLCVVLFAGAGFCARAATAEESGASALSLDPSLAGVWVNENMINSGGGDFASFTTVMTMEFDADGRVRQYTESVGGGGDWSYDGGRSLDFEGEWRTDGGVLYVLGMGLTDWTPAGTYLFSGEYLVTQSDRGRLIWQRR